MDHLNDILTRCTNLRSIDITLLSPVPNSAEAWMTIGRTLECIRISGFTLTIVLELINIYCRAVKHLFIEQPENHETYVELIESCRDRIQTAEIESPDIAESECLLSNCPNLRFHVHVNQNWDVNACAAIGDLVKELAFHSAPNPLSVKLLGETNC